MRNVCALLYYVHIFTKNRINGKLPCAPIIHFYIIVWFHIRRHFLAILSIRVSDSGYPVNCTRKHSTNNPCHKLHHFMPARSTRHYTLLHSPMILHMKTLFLRHPVTCTRKYRLIQNYHIIHWCTHTCLTRHSTLQNIIQK